MTGKKQMSMQAESVLIEQCRSKNLSAYRILVEQYKKQAYGFAFSYLKNAEDALNVSQDAFIRAWKSIDTFEKGRSFRPWLFSIVKNLSLNLIEKKKSLHEISLNEAMEESGFDIADTSDDPQQLLEKKETGDMVWKAVMELKDEFREVIVLKHFQDLSYREIAETVGAPEGTVMSRLYHARLALKKSLETVV
ncbi:MAG: sigma-70 family RNA polymerase sigma factor [Candidatus Latescibacteria bacterium]|nr:sigma-70 family RNA polymerase sigma factor [Candidatus Latescibacterota bacterium]